jgi:hypothetical protein
MSAARSAGSMPSVPIATMIRNQVSALSASPLLRISSTFCRAFAAEFVRL